MKKIIKAKNSNAKFEIELQPIINSHLEFDWNLKVKCVGGTEFIGKVITPEEINKYTFNTNKFLVMNYGSVMPNLNKLKQKLMFELFVYPTLEEVWVYADARAV